MSDKFEFTYTAPTEAERREIESIKRQYSAPPAKTKLQELRELNKRVTRPPFTVSLIIGIIGTLIMGVGMTMGLEWNMLLWGSVVGVVGIAIAASAYFIYKAILKHNKQKYGQRIINLSNELLNEEE